MPSRKPILSDDLAYWASQRADIAPRPVREPIEAPHLAKAVERAQTNALLPKDASHQSRDAQHFSAFVSSSETH